MRSNSNISPEGLSHCASVSPFPERPKITTFCLSSNETQPAEPESPAHQALMPSYPSPLAQIICHQTLGSRPQPTPGNSPRPHTFQAHLGADFLHLPLSWQAPIRPPWQEVFLFLFPPRPPAGIKGLLSTLLPPGPEVNFL